MGGWEETQSGEVTSTDQTDIPDNTTSCPVNKEEGGEEEGVFGVTALVFLNIHFSWRWLNT